MTDIVERLRTWADIHRHGARPGGDLMAEAADEIERLRELRATDLELREGDRAEIERLRAENNLVRDALMRLVSESMYRDHPEATKQAINALGGIEFLYRDIA